MPTAPSRRRTKPTARRAQDRGKDTTRTRGGASPGLHGKITRGGAAMPVHDWSGVDANVFHHFHQRWTIAICDALNNGLLPDGYSALVEQHAAGLVPDVLALQRTRRGLHSQEPTGGALAAVPPKKRHVMQNKEQAPAAPGKPDATPPPPGGGGCLHRN